MNLRGVRSLRRFASALVWVGLAGCHVSPLAGPHDLSAPPLDLRASAEAARTPGPARPTEKNPYPEKMAVQDRLDVPPEMPGADRPPLKIPPYDPERHEARDRVLFELYGAFGPLPKDPVPTEGPELDLVELQRRLWANHPGLRSARAAIESARGTAIQAGLPPNPILGYEGDSVGTGATAGQMGAKFEQLIKTAGKLQLAQSAAMIDVINAQVAYRRTQIDLATQVRSAYFAVLVAEENLRLNYAIARFFEETYRVIIDNVRAGQDQPYEPLAHRALVEQARVTLAQSHYKYKSAWRQLAAAVGQPDLPPAPLAGSAAMSVPELDYERLRARMLTQHTDVLTAANSIIKHRYQLQLARVTPIPDIALKLVVEKDFSTPPYYTVTNFEVGVPVPVWDRNQGNIHQAENDVARAIQDLPRTQLDLLGKLADATERFQSNKRAVESYLRKILPDQVQEYRSVLQRSAKDPEKTNFADVVTAQIMLQTSLNTYLTALAAQWTAVVDLAALAQLDELYIADGFAALGKSDALPKPEKPDVMGPPAPDTMGPPAPEKPAAPKPEKQPIRGSATN